MEIKELKGTLNSIVKEMETKLPYASAFASSEIGFVAHNGQTRVSAGQNPTIKGVTFTGFNGEHFVEESTSVLEPSHLADVAKKVVIRALASEKSSEAKCVEIDCGPELVRDFSVTCEIDPLSVSVSDMLAEAKSWCDKIPQCSSHVVNCGAVLGYAIKETLFVNRARTLYQYIPRWDATWYAILAKEGATVTASGGRCIPGGPESTKTSMGSMAEQLKLYEKALGAPRISDPGMHTCVISPGVAGLLAHEAFGHGTETDMYLKKRAKGASYMNRRVGAKGVSMFDSPLMERLPGSYFFDDEGLLASETAIIDDGILVNGLTDLNSAVRLGMKRTPNGRRQDYAHKVYARMTNTYFGSGKDSVEDMIKSVDSGYLIELPSNGMEDPKGWGVQCEMRLARRIIDGEVTDECFSPVIMTGYVPDILSSITMTGRDLEFFSLGSCGKGKMKEMIRVSYGGPWLKLTARIA